MHGAAQRQAHFPIKSCPLAIDRGTQHWPPQKQQATKSATAAETCSTVPGQLPPHARTLWWQRTPMQSQEMPPISTHQHPRAESAAAQSSRSPRCFTVSWRAGSSGSSHSLSGMPAPVPTQDHPTPGRAHRRGLKIPGHHCSQRPHSPSQPKALSSWSGPGFKGIHPLPSQLPRASAARAGPPSL